MPTDQELRDRLLRARLQEARDAEKQDQEKLDGVSEFESGLRGAAQGLTLGFGDEIVGGLESAFTDKTYEQARDESRLANKLAQEANPGWYTTGEVGGGIAGAVGTGGIGAGLRGAKAVGTAGKAIMGSSRGAGTKALQAAALGGGAGAVQGAGASDAELGSAEMISDIGTGAKFGAAFGPVAQVAGNTASKASKFLKEFGNEKALKAAVGRNQTFFKKLGDEKKQEVGQWLLDKEIVGATKTAKKSFDEVLQLKDELKEAYKATNQAVDAHIPNAVDGKKISQKILDYAADLPSDPNSNRIKNRLLEEAQFFEQRGNFGMDEALTLRSTSYNYNPKVDFGNPDKQLLGKQGYNLINKAIRDSEDDAIRILSNEVEDEGLKKLLKSHADINDSYSKIKTIEDAMQNHVAREQSNSWLGLREQLGGGAAFVASVDPVTTMLAIGAAKGSKKFGNQAVAKVAQKLSKGFKNSEQMLGKYGQALNQAAQRGPASFMATHQALMQNDDTYKQYMDRMDTKKDYGNIPAPEQSFDLNETDNQRNANHYVKSQQGK